MTPNTCFSETNSTTNLPTSKIRNVFYLYLGGFLVLALLAPKFIYPVFLMQVLCFALFACAFNLLAGYAGLYSLGHAAFFGSACYITAHTVKVAGWPPEIGILAGIAIGAVLGLAVGWLAIRRHGVYLVMITFALSEVVYFFAVQMRFTGGEDGIQSVPRGKLFGIINLSDNSNMYYLVLIIFVIGFSIVYRIIHSPFGEILKAIRENESRVVSLGYKVNQYKLLAFVLSAALSGLAGGTKALVLQLASLTDVNFFTSGSVILMSLVGGLGTVFGPPIGACILVGMDNYLAQFGSWVLVIQGAIFVICVLVFRRGIVGEVLRLRHHDSE